MIRSCHIIISIITYWLIIIFYQLVINLLAKLGFENISLPAIVVKIILSFYLFSIFICSTELKGMVD